MSLRERVANCNERNARLLVVWLVVIGVAIEVLVSANRVESSFSSPLVRAVNFFVFFTAWSNLLIAYVQRLHLKPHTLTLFERALAVASLGAAPIVFIIHRIYLAGPLTGFALLSDILIHILVPIAAVVVWVRFEPRMVFSFKSILLSLLFPTVWLAFTFTRGAATDWYPYDFLNPNVEEAGTIIRNIASLYGFMYAWIGVFWLYQTKFHESGDKP